MKNLAKLNGAKALSKKEQKNVFGGKAYRECAFSSDPSTDWCCALPQGCPDSN